MDHDPHTFKMKLAAGYYPTGGNGWISSPPHHQHPSSRHHGLRLEGCYQTNMCQKVSMQMAGSVCSFAYNYHFLHLHLAFDKCFGKCFLLSFYQEHMNLHLDLDRNIPPPSCAPSPHCFMTSHPVASCHITVQRGPGVEWHQTVSQHLWWDLQLQG